MARRDDLPDNVQTTDEPGEDGVLKWRRERFGEMQTFWAPIHEAAVEDDQFIAGDHWNEEIKKDREEEGRPMLTYNMFPAALRQITNKVRQDRPQLRIKPVESDRAQTPDVSNVQGTQDYSMADVFMGLWRNMEHISKAHQAYDTALQHAAEHSFGFFGMNTRYCRHDPFVQELFLYRFKNSYTVYMDPSAQDAVYADAQDAFVFTQMTKQSFEKKYPGKQFGNFNEGAHGQTYEGWFDKDGMTVATYYWVDWVNDSVVKMNNGRIHYYSLVKDVLDDMKRNQGIYILKERGKLLKKAVKRPVVRWQKQTAIEFLTEEVETVFEQIPIFPVLGDEVRHDGRVMYKSAIRDAKDAQRSYNYHRTAEVETVGLQPKAPYIGTDKQFQGHEDDWDDANRSNKARLTYNTVESSSGAPLPPPKREPPPTTSGAELTLALQDLQDIRFIIGLQEADLGIASNEKSGKAILARQQQGATATFQFPDNLGRAIEEAGRVFVQAAPRIIDTSRVLRIRLPDDKEDFVEINKLERDAETGKTHLVHDLGYGKYDVTIDTGPSYQTQREEAVEAMLELLGALPPELAQLVVHLIVEQMAFPGADKVAAILRKALPDQFKSEEDRAADLPKGVIFDDQGNPVYEESGEHYEPPPNPEQQTRQMEAQAEQEKQKAEQTKNQATVAKAEADMAEAQAKMAEVQAGDQDGDGEPDYTGILPEIERIIGEAFDEHAMDENAHKDAIEAAFATAVVDILKRVKRYVDGQTKQLLPPDRNGPDDPTGESGAAGGSSGASRPAAPDVRLVVGNEQQERPDRIDFETDAEGNLAAAIPRYSNNDDED